MAFSAAEIAEINNSSIAHYIGRQNDRKLRANAARSRKMKAVWAARKAEAAGILYKQAALADPDHEFWAVYAGHNVDRKRTNETYTEFMHRCHREYLEKNPK